MGLIELIITVCAVSQPAQCEERHIQFASSMSPAQCMMTAPPYIAQWISEHPKWIATRWRCEHPSREKSI
jgi:hypothetical protein